MPVFGCLDIEAINLLGPAGPRHPPGISNTFTVAGKKRIIAAIPHQAGSKNTFGGRARLGQKLITGGNDDVKSIDTLQPIAERAIEVGANSFPDVERKSVIPLVVKRTQIIRLMIKTSVADRNWAIHEP